LALALAIVGRMLEVELKFRVADHSAVRARLRELGAECLGEVWQRDRYLKHPQRDFAKTDEALRIRESDSQTSLTYKGPLVDRVSKTREEIEVDLAGEQAREALAAILRNLGFEPVLTVAKRRERWRFVRDSREIEVACDAIEGLGAFVELETLAPWVDLESAREALMSLANELQLRADAIERRGYLTLLLEDQPNSASGP